MGELHSSEEICEALVRHVETTGSEVFEKFFVKNDKVICAVWCIVGDNADAFRKAIHEWMKENGFKPDN